MEGQFQRDPRLLFAVWNLGFGTIVNGSSNFSAIRNFKRDNKDPSSVCQAAVLIMRRLHGKYTSTHGNGLQVGGDLQKVNYSLYISIANPVSATSPQSTCNTLAIV